MVNLWYVVFSEAILFRKAKFKRIWSCEVQKEVTVSRTQKLLVEVVKCHSYEISNLNVLTVNFCIHIFTLILIGSPVRYKACSFLFFQLLVHSRRYLVLGWDLKKYSQSQPIQCWHTWNAVFHVTLSRKSVSKCTPFLLRRLQEY